MEYDWTRYDYESGTQTGGTSAGNSRDSSTRQVYYSEDDYLYRQTNEHLRYGSGPPALQGTWKIQCIPYCYYDGDDGQQSYTGELQELTVSNGLSGKINWPLSEAWITAKINDPAITCFEIWKNPCIQSRALLTLDNMPPVSYQYWDEISLNSLQED